MTPAKFIVMLVVIVGVVYGVSFAVQERTRHQRVDPNAKGSWTNTLGQLFEKHQRLEPEKDLAPAGKVRDGRVTVPAGTRVITLTVTENKDRAVRKATFSVTGAEAFAIDFQPSRADTEAVRVEVKDLSAHEPVKMVFLKHGGTLTFTRKSSLTTATTISIR